MGQSELKNDNYYKSFVPYIKQTTRKHESGWRMFEVGYISGSNIDPDSEVIKFGVFADAIHIWNEGLGCSHSGFNLDITPKGRIRLIPRGGSQLCWEDFATSDFMLKEGDPTEHILAILKRRNK